MTAIQTRPAPHPAQVPLYTLLDAANYLRAPLWLVATAHFRDHPFRFFRHGPFPPFALWDDGEVTDGGPGWLNDTRLNFRTLAEWSVRIATLPVLGGPSEKNSDRRFTREYGRWMDELFDWLVRDLPQVRFDDTSVEARGDDLVAAVKRPLDDGQRAILRKLLTVSLGRIEVESGEPARLFPLTRDPSLTAPRVVALDPRVRFGRPSVRATPTDTLFERFRAGDSTQELAEDYGLSATEIEEAIRYESATSCPDFCAWQWGL